MQAMSRRTDAGSLARAVRGPVILITLGILFAIDHFGSLRFERSWPVLIIVIGIMKLLERPSQPQQGVPQAQQGGGMPPTNHPGGLPR
jgi:hypothetical protein